MNALQKSVRKLRGRKVRVVANDGREFIGWLERVSNGGHLVLRDAEDVDARDRVDPAHIRAVKSVVGVEPDGRVERIAVDEIAPAPYHARKFDRSENRKYIEEVRNDGWTGSFPVVRPTTDGLEVVEGHKRLWVAEQAGLKDHPVRIVDVDDWAAARRFAADHLPDERHIQDDGTADGYYGADEIAEAVATLVDCWGDRALDLERVAWNVDRLGLEVGRRTGWTEDELEREEDAADVQDESDDAEVEEAVEEKEADAEDDETQYWCEKCGYGPSTKAGVARHHGHAHDGDASIVQEAPADPVGGEDEPTDGSDHEPEPEPITVDAVDDPDDEDEDDVDFPDGINAEDVEAAAEKWNTVGEVGDELGVTRGRARTLTHAVGCYGDLRDVPSRSNRGGRR